MGDPLSIIGGIAAGTQLISTAAKALLATVKLVKDLKEVPERLVLLLDEVDVSISRLSNYCEASSKVFQHLNHLQADQLIRCTNALSAALQDIHCTSTPLLGSKKGKKGSIGHLWEKVVLLKIEKELSQKSRRLNRLSLEMTRELVMLGLEIQIGINELVTANNAASTHGFSNVGAQIQSLQNDFRNFTLTAYQAHATAIVNPSQVRSLPPSSEPGESSRELGNGSELAVGSHMRSAGEELTQEQTDQKLCYLSGGSTTNTTYRLREISTDQLSDTNLEFILFSIRTYYTTGNFDRTQITTRTKFWVDTDLAIYLMDVSKRNSRGASQGQTRGLGVLKQVMVDGSNTLLGEGTATILIELLSTLSPIVTNSCSHVRANLLQYLSKLAREQLHRDHPITLVINRLKNDNGDRDVSLRALTFVAKRLRTTLSPIHGLTLLATKRLVALLRRRSNYAEALRVVGEGVRAIRDHLGPGSSQERRLSRQLEHIYIDQGNWPAALKVCLDVVGQQQLDSSSPDPLYHDECAVYTMEDIAKIYECMGDLEQAVRWLKQARISGGIVWGRTESLAHIQDKLNELLKQMDRTNELEVWATLDNEASEK